MDFKLNEVNLKVLCVLWCDRIDDEVKLFDCSII